MADSCLTPATTCLPWYLQSPAMQDYLMIRFLCTVAGTLGSTIDCTDEAALKALADEWLCEGSPAVIMTKIAQMICEQVSRETIDCTVQPACWTPLQLAGAKAYLICHILELAAAPQ